MKVINLSFILFMLIALSGCDNSLDAFMEDKGVYSIYGYLNLYEEVNFIRVKDLNRTLDETDKEIDAVVVLENLDKGLTQTLKDTVVDFNGVKTHNFRTTMNIEPDTDYKVTVERSDGKTTSAITTTPYISGTTVDPMGANCTTRVNINFEPIRSKFALNLELGFYYKHQLFWVRVNRLKVETENKVNINFTPSTIINEPFEQKLYCEHLSDDKFEVRYTHYSPGIFEESVSDTLQIPGGAGRLGAFYKDSFSFPIDTTNICPPSC